MSYILLFPKLKPNRERCLKSNGQKCSHRDRELTKAEKEYCDSVASSTILTVGLFLAFVVVGILKGIIDFINSL